MLLINSKLAGGNIELVEITEDRCDLRIVPDNQSEFKQWFYFKASNVGGQRVTFRILDADKAAYPQGWADYNVCCSYDGEDWFRVPTRYDEHRLEFSMEFEHDSAYFAYFAPYSYERHLSLIHAAAMHPIVGHEVLGETLDGREMNLLTVGNPDAEKSIWIIARQHPGETMAEWFMEGLIERLLDADESISRQLLQSCCFYLVPNMNPDGSERGHLRTNAIGVNLNREWDKASMEQSPEVYLVREKMKATGVDLFVDVHGDEGLPYVFIAGSEGIPRFDENMAKQEAKFKADFMAASPDFQDEFGYPKDEPGQADLSIASSWVGQEFGCLSVTLEMPFKDNANLPDLERGWSPERSMLLGATMLQPILHQIKS